ncbi:MAG: MFS transporter [Spirochaetales bacterium]|nr:MFS transporter [Spirochaetales bacterium]
MSVTFIALYAIDLGAGIFMSGLIVMAKSLGAMIFNLPAGFIIGRWKSLPLMVAGLTGILLSTLMRGLISTPLLLLVASFLLGISATIWDLTRLTYIRNNIPIQYRGRILSGMGGLFRLSRIIGPIAGGFLITMKGYPVMFFLQSAFVLLAIILILILLPRGRKIISSSANEPLSYLKEHISKNRRNITAAIVGIIGISMLRVARDFILPLWADNIGITISILGIVTSFGALIELMLFYPAGWIMDNKGRKWTIFPASVLMAAGFLVLPLTATLSGFIFSMILINIGNGLGSGINMTLGTDLAPPKSPGQFLGLWRFFSDGAMAAGPVIIGAVSKGFSLSTSPVVIGLFGIGTAAFLMKYMDHMKHS